MEEELKRFADNLIEQMNDIQQVMKETSAQLKWSHKQALNLRDEHTRLQAAFRAYINGDITIEEANSVLNNLEWE